MNSKLTWLLVAQRAEARVYEIENSKSLKLIHDFDHPSGRKKDHELGSDSPGRSFSSAGSSRHSYTQENGPSDQITIEFSKEIANFLEKARSENRFEALMIISGPSFLGNLRNDMTSDTRDLVTSEISKNLGGFSAHELNDYINKN